MTLALKEISLNHYLKTKLIKKVLKLCKHKKIQQYTKIQQRSIQQGQLDQSQKLEPVSIELCSLWRSIRNLLYIAPFPNQSNTRFFFFACRNRAIIKCDVRMWSEVQKSKLDIKIKLKNRLVLKNLIQIIYLQFHVLLCCT